MRVNLHSLRQGDSGDRREPSDLAARRAVIYCEPTARTLESLGRGVEPSVGFDGTWLHEAVPASRIASTMLAGLKPRDGHSNSIRAENAGCGPLSKGLMDPKSKRSFGVRARASQAGLAFTLRMEGTWAIYSHYGRRPQAGAAAARTPVEHAPVVPTPIRVELADAVRVQKARAVNVQARCVLASMKTMICLPACKAAPVHVYILPPSVP